ncbi:uncharacterized protein LOC111796532 isoform X1 [Cucurbita pepo subsp. pepo]|uniref:uncharacterized protein LOC111796532 isoform X1 n=1 Tax=Cucurbita pepo subsp. pepo TaxID=3664 RepID=UPI000C9D3EB2|nr:uncharacterized protein LOC111796532 isoform X1 [Cucurbita pepo subsp. pepo]
MEALWNLEDKWKLSTQQAFILLTCTAVAVLGFCAAAWAKQRKCEKTERRQTKAVERWWWKGAADTRKVSGGGETPVRLLGGEGEGEDFGSRNSTAAVWQRPILMGEKCEMLKYSGLILYDERGRLLQDQIAAMENGYKVLLRRRRYNSKNEVEGSTLMSFVFYGNLQKEV